MPDRAGKLTVLFVCTGNTCRSPMAEGILRERLKVVSPEPGITVDSAGLNAFDGQPATTEALSVAMEIGVDISRHTAKSFWSRIESGVDLILVMTNEHRKVILRNYPELEDRVFLLREYGRKSVENKGWDIKDPFGGSLEVYRECRHEIEVEIDRILPVLTGLQLDWNPQHGNRIAEDDSI